MNRLKSIEIMWFLFPKVFNFFLEYIRMENPNYKNENIERKYLNIMRKNQFLKVKNSLLELEKDFIDLKDKEVKIKKEIEWLFLNQLLYL